MSIRQLASTTARLSPMSAWQRLQQLRWTLRRRKQVAAYLADHSVRKLQIGAGFHSFAGWLNTDLEPRGTGFVFMDATEPFPLPDRSFDYVFTEHIIEHIPYLAGKQMLIECHRILRPGGRIRIATPDLQKLLQLNSELHSDIQLRYMKWITDQFLPHVERPTPIFVINNAFRNWGHQFLYDRTTLLALLDEIGFVDAISCESGQSTDPALAGIDSHGACIQDQEMNQFESMVIEARKPS